MTFPVDVPAKPKSVSLLNLRAENGSDASMQRPLSPITNRPWRDLNNNQMHVLTCLAMGMVTYLHPHQTKNRYGMYLMCGTQNVSSQIKAFKTRGLARTGKRGIEITGAGRAVLGDGKERKGSVKTRNRNDPASASGDDARAAHG